jgi:hypothetical protein
MAPIFWVHFGVLTQIGVAVVRHLTRQEKGGSACGLTNHEFLPLFSLIARAEVVLVGQRQSFSHGSEDGGCRWSTEPRRCLLCYSLVYVEGQG